MHNVCFVYANVKRSEVSRILTITALQVCVCASEIARKIE